MNKWEKRVTKFLNQSEYHFLKEYDHWLHSAFAHIPIGVDEHAVHGFHLQTGQRLSSILFKNSSAIFTSGQAHGSEDCQNILQKNKRKFADLPTIDMQYADKNDTFTPHDAIKVLKERSIILAGDVESDITSSIKEILLRHLTGLPRKQTEQEIAELLDKNMNRASLITWY